MPGGVSRAITCVCLGRRSLHHCQRLVAVGIILRARRPGVNLDAVLTEEETQLGGMPLDVTHVVETQLQKADRLSLGPGILDGPARLLVRQRLDGRTALLAHGRRGRSATLPWCRGVRAPPRRNRAFPGRREPGERTPLPERPKDRDRARPACERSHSSRQHGHCCHAAHSPGES